MCSIDSQSQPVWFGCYSTGDLLDEAIFKGPESYKREKLLKAADPSGGRAYVTICETCLTLRNFPSVYLTVHLTMRPTKSYSPADLRRRRKPKNIQPILC